MTIITILVIALIGEALWETLKMIWQSGKVNVDRIGAIVIGILLAFSARLDLLVVLGIPLVIPYLGYVLTGLLISRGANFLHDLWVSMQNFSVKTTTISSTPEVDSPIKKLARVAKIIKK